MDLHSKHQQNLVFSTEIIFSRSNNTELIQRAQEGRAADRRYPGNPPGIVQVPRGSKGPRSLYLRRYGDSFGFTLRHFIVYPPESIAEDDGRHAACGALLAPMDTIFVRQVRDGSPAQQAGLQRGDRLVAVNSVATAGRSYQQVVQLIANSPEYLHLLVVPKEEDVLQRFFPDSAYNPLSNQAAYPEVPVDRVSAQHILTQRIAQAPQEFRVDAASWYYLQQPYLYGYDPHHQQVALSAATRPNYRQDFARSGHQRSADSVLDPRGRGPQGHHQEIYTEIRHPNEVHFRQKSRAQPQVPLYRKMGRRASEGSNLLASADYSATSLTSSDGDCGQYGASMRAMHNEPYYLPPGGDAVNLPDAACRLQSSEATRRESTSSLSSSIADSSKGSLTSFGSNSTLTGQEIDDSVRISRVRQSVRQKEEFLRTPVFREFHGRPKKLDRPVWPPNDATVRPRVKPDEMHNGGVASWTTPTVDAHSPQQAKAQPEGVLEAETAPSFDASETSRQSVAEARRMNAHPHFQNVQKKAKEFESYPVEANRRDFSRSELARLSKKVLQPNVNERALEYEVKTSPKDPPTSTPPPVSSGANLSTVKRIQRDSRSLDSSGSNSSIYEPLSSLARQRLSGNVIISSGSKYIHCPPPGTEPRTPDIPSVADSRQFRARSNSAESWATALGDKDWVTATPPPQMSTPPAFPLQSPSPLIPEPVRQLQFPRPAISVTPPAPRPSSLDLDQPQRPARGHFRTSESTNTEPIVVKRRAKNHFGNDERARRPESYLKATKGDQGPFGCDLSDYEEVPAQVLRNRYRKWHPSPFYGDIDQLRKMFEDAASSKGGSANSSSSSLDKDKTCSSPILFKSDSYGVVREGPVNCKILEIDGKRATDRSWKQVTMVLKGPKLFLYKDRHHQSPMGTSDVSLDQSLSSGVDMRSSAVRVAGDYTKRKNVLRMSTVKPCRSEFLIQAESSEDFADWVKTLQQQVAVSTEAELDQPGGRQRAVPQAYAASSSIQVPASHLSPQPSNKNGKTSMSSRNRSPTGQSPVSKTRKPSSHNDGTIPTTSPKSKTWRGRVAKQFKKFNQGATSPTSPTAPEVSTFGIPIEHCITSSENCYLPRFVEVCTDIIDEKGLGVTGIYRVPGNNASITALSEEINRNFEEVPLDDPKWNDLHVVSSLLKSFLRKMPDSLVTSALYPHFIKADKIEDPKSRLEELRKLVRNLPKHNYHTLKHVVLHLKRVADNSHLNRMEAKNLAIVFGPTIVRPESETMESMVTNMNNHCKIVESLIANAEWFFPETDNEAVAPTMQLATPGSCDDFETNNQALLNNISKYEALKDQKEKNGALLSSLFTAAHRKVMRKPSRTHDVTRDEPTTPTGLRAFEEFSDHPSNEKTPDLNPHSSKANLIPTTVMEIENRDRSKPSSEKNWFNYKTDQSDFSRRIQIFKQETEAMLQRPRMTEISVPNIDAKSGPLSASASNVNSGSRVSLKPHQDILLTKTHSATNVFARPSSPANQNSRNSMGSSHYTSAANSDVTRYSYGAGTEPFGDLTDGKISRYGMRRGSSVENVNSSAVDLNSNNGGLKKVRYETENDSQRKGSLDSLHKIPTDDESLLSAMTKIIDQKLKQKPSTPEKSGEATECRPGPEDSYKNPSLHKNQSVQLLQSRDAAAKEAKADKEKEEDTRASEQVPDNERHLSLAAIASKLRRSESLNRPDRSIAALATKVKRSESLNKNGGDKLKRSDSLTKTEKTESNINKRRELLSSGRRFKEATKNKRKNGMPDRSIKRRHTVGGTKDPDKVTYLMDNRQDENNPNAENNKEKGIRTSSPDLSGTRRERFLFEINLIAPENMVVALKQHLIGTRPQSFAESNAFKVPLESHV